MNISIVTDEISSDFETAIELGAEWGIHDFELRGVGSNRVPYLSEYQIDKILKVLAQYDARIVALSPGLFKIPYIPAERNRFPVESIDNVLYNDWLYGRDLMKFHLEDMLPATIDFARKLDISLILAFGFDRGGLLYEEPPAEIVEYFRKASELVSAAGLQLAIEVEKGFWADTGEKSAALVRKVDHPDLGINWDPGNAIEAGDIPFPDGYEAVRDLVRHVHFKDVLSLPSGGYKYAVEGDIDWSGQIQALLNDGYEGYISVEPHMTPKIKTSRLVVDRLISLIK